MEFAYSALMFAGLFCTARFIVDLRARRFWWAAAALVSALGIFAMPITVYRGTAAINVPVNQ
jgi:uncharacterized membrane protein YbhN (UPF0104 family)